MRASIHNIFIRSISKKHIQNVPFLAYHLRSLNSDIIIVENKTVFARLKQLFKL